MKINKQNYRIILQAGVLTALLINVFILFSLTETNSSPSKELSVTVLTAPDCERCFDFSDMIDYYLEQGISQDQIESIEYDSFKGEKIINKFNLGTVPTVLVTGNIDQYSFLQELVGPLARIQEDTLVLNDGVQPPYIDLETNQRRGDFEIVYIDDATCEECYEVDLHKPVFERMIMEPTKESYLDISEDEAVTLVEEYAITAIPTILLRGDLEVYKPFNEAWSIAGTVEDDGVYVLRQGVVSMGTYKSLPSGDLILAEEDPLIQE